MHSAAINAAIKFHFGTDHDDDALATCYFALFNGDPTGAGVEPTTAGGYARVGKTNNDTNFPISGATASVVDVVFPVTTALWSQTTLTHWAIVDGATGGTIWYSGPLPSNITITGAGEYPTIAGLQITQQA